MKITIISNKEKVLKYITDERFFKSNEISFYPLSYVENEIIKNDSDTECLLIDAVAKVSKNLIASLPKLRLIQSEGVGFNGVDSEFAKSKGIAICNAKGVNSNAVAEGTILLMLGVLRQVVEMHNVVYDGRQMEIKEKLMLGGIQELAECTIGLIGLGSIGIEVAKRLVAFGANVVYYNRTRKKDLEKELNIHYCEIDELLSKSDIVSLHIASNSETKKIADAKFFQKMKDSSIFINTSRGELVNNSDLKESLKSGKLFGAGLDTISPEPVTKENILLTDDIKDKLVLSPHIAGITEKTFKKSYKIAMKNIENLSNGNPLINVVQ